MTAMAIVLTALRGEPPPDAPDDAIQQALKLAESHHALPMVLLGMPEPLRAAHWSQVRLQGFWWTHELKGVIAGFHTAAVPMIPLKGPAFAERAFGAAGLRPCRDLDILVQPASLPAAHAALAALGFASADEGDDYHQTWMRGATAVELHRGVAIPGSFHFDLPSAWSRAEQGTFAGSNILQFAPHDELIYLCLHAARHRFERLSMALDLHRALARCGGRITPALVTLARRQRLEGALWVGCALAAHLSGEGVGEIPPQFAEIADELWGRLISGPPVAFDTAELYRFWMRLEPTRTARIRRRIDHLKIAATRLIADDYVFAKRFGILRRHQNLVRGLRVFRLLGRYFGR